MLKRHRGHNAKTQPGLQGAVPVEFELAALDDLGPRARFAIVNSPLNTLAYAIIDQVIRKNDAIETENHRRATLGLQLPQLAYIDPKEPRLDALFAQHIVNDQFKLLNDERGFADARAGITPMNDRQSAKSLREQRRAERASRRMMR